MHCISGQPWNVVLPTAAIHPIQNAAIIASATIAFQPCVMALSAACIPDSSEENLRPAWFSARPYRNTYLLVVPGCETNTSLPAFPLHRPHPLVSGSLPGPLSCRRKTGTLAYLSRWCWTPPRPPQSRLRRGTSAPGKLRRAVEAVQPLLVAAQQEEDYLETVCGAGCTAAHQPTRPSTCRVKLLACYSSRCHDSRLLASPQLMCVCVLVLLLRCLLSLSAWLWPPRQPLMPAVVLPGRLSWSLSQLPPGGSEQQQRRLERFR